MADDLGPTLQQEFHDQLLAAVDEVRHHTRLGTTRLLQSIQRVGGLDAAREILHWSDPASEWYLSPGPGAYFLAAKRVGRTKLSVEAMALDPRWRSLFTPEELKWAAATLSEEGADPTPTDATPSKGATAVTTTSHGLFLVLEQEGSLDDLDELRFRSGDISGCELTSRLAATLRDSQRAPARRAARQHLRRCPRCCEAHPQLVAAFERFDVAVEEATIVLLEAFKTSMELGA